MNDNKHTPGPWRISKSLSGEEAAIIDSKSSDQFSGSICQLFKQLRSKDPEGEKLANAKLIAAAPEMYEIVKELYEYSMSTGHKGLIFPKLDAVMTKINS